MTVLTGAFLDIVIVEDPDGTPTETILGKTSEDVEIDREPEEIEWPEHGNPRMQRREGHESATLTFQLLVTEDGQNLIDTGVMDAEGNITRNVIHDRVRIDIFTDEGDTEPSRQYFMDEVQFVYQSLELPIDGPGAVEIEGWVHANHGFVQNGGGE